jgi:hypothetical protein
MLVTLGKLVTFPFKSYPNPVVVTWFVVGSTVSDIEVPVCPAVGVFEIRFPHPSYPND